jgi:DNA primase large subunit
LIKETTITTLKSGPMGGKNYNNSTHFAIFRRLFHLYMRECTLWNKRIQEAKLQQRIKAFVNRQPNFEYVQELPYAILLTDVIRTCSEALFPTYR